MALKALKMLSKVQISKQSKSYGRITKPLYELSASAYQQAQQAQQQAGGAGANAQQQTQTKDDDNVVDADFKDVTDK